MGIDPCGYSHKSFRIGMACTVLENQCVVKGGKEGVTYVDCGIEYMEQSGRWTNSE